MPKKGKPLVNHSEGRALQILQTTAQFNSAVVYPKIRVADTIRFENLNLSKERFRYALQSHFDFVVCEPELPHVALFAVEYDGDEHLQPDGIRKDQIKNELCEGCEFPIARVHGQHLEEGNRGANYLTWLAELYFADRAVEQAYHNGSVPPDEFIDASMFLEHERISGKFPFAYGLQNRARLTVLHRSGRISSPFPTIIRAADHSGRCYCMVIIKSGAMYAVTEDCIYLWGFSLLSEEAAAEVAIDRLPISDGDLGGKGWVDSTRLRVRLTAFLRKHPNASFRDGTVRDFGFTVIHDWRTRTWIVGAHGRAPEFRITDKIDD